MRARERQSVRGGAVPLSCVQVYNHSSVRYRNARRNERFSSKIQNEPYVKRARARYQNMTPIRVINAAMPSYTRYLNPHGSLVSWRRDLVKATQSIPGPRVPPSPPRPFYKRRVARRPYLSRRLPPGSSDWIISLHFDCPRFHRPLDRLRRSFFSRVTRSRPSTRNPVLMASISANCA